RECEKAIPARKKPGIYRVFPRFFRPLGKAAAEEDSDETGGTDPTAPAERGNGKPRCRNPGGGDGFPPRPARGSVHRIARVYGGRSPVCARSGPAGCRRRGGGGGGGGARPGGAGSRHPAGNGRSGRHL